MIAKFDGEYAWLSNFYPVSVDFGQFKYASVEHAYQAAKSTDPKVWEKFTQGTAKDAKRWGKAVKLRPDWNDVRLSIMEDLLRQKFSNQELRDALIATGDQELVEGNWWGDTFWGVCKGVGENHLGKLLMKIRAELNATETV